MILQRWFALTLLCACTAISLRAGPIIAAEVSPEVLSALDMEALRRISDFIRTHNQPFDTVELIFEIHGTDVPSPLDIERALATASSGEGPVAPDRLARRRREIAQTLGGPWTRRFVLAVTADNLYRYDRISESVDLSDPDRASLITNGRSVTQGRGVNWDIDHLNRRVHIAHRHRPLQEILPHMRQGFGECEHYLRWGNMTAVLEDIRGVTTGASEDGRVVAAARMAEDSIRSPLQVELKFNPDGPREALFDSILILSPPTRGAVYCEMSVWRDADGFQRPMRIDEWTWEDVDFAQGVDRAHLMDITPGEQFSFRAQRVEFNTQIDAEYFVCDPPEDYEVYEEADDGSWRLTRLPGSRELAEIPAPLSARQRQIQDRLTTANRPHRAVYLLVFGGVGLLLIGLALRFRRGAQ